MPLGLVAGVRTSYASPAGQFRIDRCSAAPAPEIPVQGSKNCFNHLGPLAFAGADLRLRLDNAPATSDRGTILRMLRDSGVHTALIGDSVLTDGRPFDGAIAPHLGRRLRVSICYAAALAANLGWADCPFPGGDAFTRRPIDLHLRVLEAAGARCVLSADGTHLSIRFRGAPRGVHLSVASPYGPSMGASVTGLLVAAQATGPSVLSGLCLEPEVTGVIDALRALGVDIRFEDHDTVRVEGAGGPLGGDLRTTVCPDRMEAATYLLIGAARGLPSTTVTGIGLADLPSGLRAAFTGAGLHLSASAGGVTVRPADPTGLDLDTGPHPAFPTDVQPQMAAFLTGARGPSSIAETIYASRITHVPELDRLGLRIRVEGSRQHIEGGQRARGGDATVHDIRCGAALIIAAATAEAPVTIDDSAGHLGRGYGDLADKLAELGVDLRFAA